MFRFTAYFFALSSIALQISVDAAPLSARAPKSPGNFLQCNIARIETVAGLAGATAAVQRMSTAVGSDATMAAAVTSAQSGLKDAQTGIQTIARALIQRQPPPSAARDQVGKGLNTAQTALAAVNSSDKTMTSLLNNARTKLKQTIAAGQQVVNSCGSAAVNPNPNDGAATATTLPSSVTSTIATESLTATAITGIETSTGALGTATATAITGTSVATAISGAVTNTASGVASVTSIANTDAATSCAPPVSTTTLFVTTTVQPTATGIVNKVGGK